MADGGVRFVAESINGYFDHRGVQINAAGSAATGANGREIIDTTWERLLAQKDGQTVDEY